jgi:diguanylate cyclase (GGDEF)-like protein
MAVSMNPHFSLLALTAVINALVAAIAWQRRDAALVRTYFSLMMVSATFYAAVAAMEARATVVSAKIFWSTLEYVGTGGLVICFVLFAETFAHHRLRFRPRQLLRLSLWPVANVLLVATNSWHHWVWRSVEIADPSSTLAIYHHGPGYVWVLACIYSYGLRSMQLLGHAGFSEGPLRRRQALLLLLGSVFPYLSGALYSLRLTPPGLNLTPMSFMATGIFFFIALFHMGVFDAIPIARERLIEHLRDGVIVVDLQHRIIDINSQGRSQLGFTDNWMKRSIHSALAHLPDLLHHYDQGLDPPFGLWLRQHPPCYVTVHLSSLTDYQGRLQGRLLILHDMTKRYQAEVELRQANDRLQQQLAEIESLQTQLKIQAQHDQLTQLFNRHYLNEWLPQTLQRAQQTGDSVVFVMFDIDYFKRINDTYGHRMGDLVLQAFSRILIDQTSGNALACRLGGEEFLVVLPGLSLAAGQHRAEVIRQAFADLATEEDGVVVKTTVSGGVALFPDHGTSDDDLLHAADQALYEAKHGGRNRIVGFEAAIAPSIAPGL